MPLSKSSVAYSRKSIKFVKHDLPHSRCIIPKIHRLTNHSYWENAPMSMYACLHVYMYVYM